MKALSIISTFFIISGLAISATAGPLEIAQGKGLAKLNCAGCHSADGAGSVDGLPDLAEKEEAYLIKQLKDFRMGFRNNLMMTPAAASLTDKDIIALAAYYASLKNSK